MKHYLKILIMGMLLHPFAYGYEESASMMLAQYQKAQQVLKRVNKIHEYANQYILLYAPTNMSFDDDTLNNASFGLKSQMWEGYQKSLFTISNGTQTTDAATKWIRAVVTYRDAFPASGLSDKVLQMIQGSADFNKKATLSKVDGHIDITIPVNTTARHFLELIQTIDSTKITVSKTQPVDTSKIWYEPDGRGGFYGHKYTDDQWKDIDANIGTNGIPVVSSIAERDKLDASQGDKVYVKDGDNAVMYIYHKSSWRSISGFNGKDELTVALECDSDNIGTIRQGDESMEYCADNNSTPTWKPFGSTASAVAPSTSDSTLMDINQQYNTYGGLYNAPTAANSFTFASLKEDGSIHIDETQCNGCGNCVQICPFDAIKRRKTNEK